MEIPWKCGGTDYEGGRARDTQEVDPKFWEGAVRIVWETGKPIAQVARDLGINEGTLGNWCARDRAERDHLDGLSGDERAELLRLRGGERRAPDGA